MQPGTRMNPSRSSKLSGPGRGDLFEKAVAVRAREIERYKADRLAPAPVLLSARRDPRVRVEWAPKF